jgi:hypothetical protein
MSIFNYKGNKFYLDGRSSIFPARFIISGASGLLARPASETEGVRLQHSETNICWNLHEAEKACLTSSDGSTLSGLSKKRQKRSEVILRPGRISRRIRFRRTAPLGCGYPELKIRNNNPFVPPSLKNIG